MAQAPAHKLGQIIGDVLEEAVEPLLSQFAQQHGLYLDKKGARAARNGKKKVSWTDFLGNTHDLDYAMERGGTNDVVGVPVAFIETAWRRYTKHSRNKVQEIQGAVLPLATTFRDSAPFVGAILAGHFTDKALEQMRTQDFSVLHFPYEIVIEAFRTAGVDVTYDEDTPDANIEGKVRAWERLDDEERARVAPALVRIESEEVRRFMRKLEAAVTRQIEFVRITPLYGSTTERTSLEEAIDFITAFDEADSAGPFVRYEIEVRYNNGDRIEASLKDKESAIRFLSSYAPPEPRA